MNQCLLLLSVTRRKETIDLEKPSRVITWAAEGLHNVSVSQVELKASMIQFCWWYYQLLMSYETIIKSAADLISVDPHYHTLLHVCQYSTYVRKRTANTSTANFYTTLKTGWYGKYDSHPRKTTSKAGSSTLNLDSYIDHKRDLDFSYAAVKQLEGKYFVQNRVTKEIPARVLQFLCYLVAACLFAK